MKLNLQKLLNEYNSILDIIVFGSYVKGRDTPNDLDLALLVEKKDLNLISITKKELNINNLHLEFVLIKEIYFNTLFLSLINEGYSIKKDDFLRNLLHIAPLRLYSYDLKHLNKSEKTSFALALKKTLAKIKGERVGIGVVLVPISSTSYFEDFLNAWEMKYKTKEWTVI